MYNRYWVAVDGFKYNWAFRARHWLLRAGVLIACGWVRQRRWVPLIIRPPDDSVLTGGASAGSKRSVTCSPIANGLGVDDVWLGDEDDWRQLTCGAPGSAYPFRATATNAGQSIKNPLHPLNSYPRLLTPIAGRPRRHGCSTYSAHTTATSGAASSGATAAPSSSTSSSHRHAR